MKTNRLLTVVACSVLTHSASANHTGMEFNVPVNNIFIGVPAGEEYQQTQTTEVVPNHRKAIGFGAVFGNAESLQPMNFAVWFDWPDPVLPGVTQMSQVQLYNIPAQSSERHEYDSFIIPFTPPQFTLHIRNDGPGGPLLFSGAL